MTFKEIKRKLKLTNSDIAKMFGYKNMIAFTTSSAKKRIEKGLENFYNHSKKLEDGV